MSTKIGIKYGETFHLYEDEMDRWTAASDDAVLPVWLQLSNVSFTATAGADATSLTVCIDRPTAVALGLLTPTAARLTKWIAEMETDIEARRQRGEAEGYVQCLVDTVARLRLLMA